MVRFTQTHQQNGRPYQVYPTPYVYDFPADTGIDFFIEGYIPRLYRYSYAGMEEFIKPEHWMEKEMPRAMVSYLQIVSPDLDLILDESPDKRETPFVTLASQTPLCFLSGDNKHVMEREFVLRYYWDAEKPYHMFRIMKIERGLDNINWQLAAKPASFVRDAVRLQCTLGDTGKAFNMYQYYFLDWEQVLSMERRFPIKENRRYWNKKTGED